MTRAPELRLTGGELRGRRLRVLPGLHVRPMRSRVREALFSMAHEVVEGGRVLDVFSGSGAIAAEAISRGAREAVAVEESKDVLPLLHANLRELALTQRVRVLELDAYEIEGRLDGRFSLIVIDPPFPHYRGNEPPWPEPGGATRPWRLAAQLTRTRLAAEGMLFLELPTLGNRPALEGVEVVRERRFGDTTLLALRALTGTPSPGPSRGTAGGRIEPG